MGFSALCTAQLHNHSDVDLVYLMGGESAAVDVVHYPDIARSMVKSTVSATVTGQISTTCHPANAKPGPGS